MRAGADVQQNIKQNLQRNSMLNKIEPMTTLHEYASMGVPFEADGRRNAPLMDKLETILSICEHAIISEDLGEFLHKAAEMIRASYDYDLVQIWTIGSRNEEPLLNSSASRILKEPIVGRTIPSLMEEVRRTKSESQGATDSLSCSDNNGKKETLAQCTVPFHHQGKTLGLLSVESSQFKTFPAEQRTFLEKVAVVIAAAFDKLNTIAKSNQSYEYLRVILNSATNLAILSTDLQGYVFAGSSGAENVFHMPMQSILGCDILSLFTDENFRRELALYMAAPGDRVFSENKLVQETENRKSYLDVSFQRMDPIDNNPVGFLCLATDVTANAILEQKLQSLSVTDALTGLFNRRHMLDVLPSEIKRSRRFDKTFSLCFFDLDGFKPYNDSRGHLEGDKALVTIAEILLSQTRSNIDSCYRFGGDEMAILMPETSAKKAALCVERIYAGIHKSLKGSITASCGIAEFTPALNAESMMELADRAMYEAKAKGGNRFVFARENAEGMQK